jgi:HlyD family secretion protein
MSAATGGTRPTGLARPLRRFRWPVLAILALLALGAWWVLAEGAGASGGDRWARIERRDLVLGVEVSGELRAEDSATVSPPQISEIWDFKIAFMAPEGQVVEPGQPVLGFDTTELTNRLQQEEVTRDSTAKNLEKKQTDLEVELRREALTLAEVEAELRKLSLQTTVPEELVAGQELELRWIDRRLKEAEVEYRRAKLEQMRRGAEGELGVLRQRRDDAARRVVELGERIARMTVPAARAGTIIYRTNWQGEKKRVGDNAWRGETILEIPNLSVMLADGEVEEAQAGRLALGQSVTLHLDAHPGERYTGTVRKIGSTVQRRSRNDPRKVVHLEIALDETDEERMRPGMRFLGTVEVERVTAALVIPLAAVRPGPQGAAVTVRRGLGEAEVLPRLGRRNAEWVEVLDGLEEGDRVRLAEGGS